MRIIPTTVGNEDPVDFALNHHCIIISHTVNNKDIHLFYNRSRIPGAYAGTTVATVYGPSRIQAVRPDGVHVARPLNWKLANNTGEQGQLTPT